MKKLKIVFVLFFVLNAAVTWAQSPILFDPILLGHRVEYTSLVNKARKQKEQVANSYNKLATAEKKYQNIIEGVDTNFDSFVLFVVSRLISVNDLETNINLNLVTCRNLPIRNLQKIIRKETELEREQGYLKRLKDDLEDPTTFNPKLVGGVGYSINYLMKIYLRLTRIESRLLELEYETKNMLNHRLEIASDLGADLNSFIEDSLKKKLNVIMGKRIQFNDKFARVYHINNDKLQLNTRELLNFSIYNHLDKK